MDYIIATSTDAPGAAQLTDVYYLEKIYQLLFIAFVIMLVFLFSKMLRRAFNNLSGKINRDQ